MLSLCSPILAAPSFNGITSLTGVASINTGSNSIQDVCLSQDGTTAIFADYANNGVRYHTLSTPWDLSTASYTGFVSLTYGQICGRFHSNGNWLMLSSWTNGYIGSWALGTPFDVTTTTGSLYYFGIASASTFGMNLSPDGTKVYYGNNTGSFFERPVSTPYQVGTTGGSGGLGSVSHTLSITSTHYGMYIDPTGTFFWTVANNGSAVHEYKMSTPWTLSTASYVGSISLSGVSSNCYGLFVSPDYKNLYVSRYGTGTDVYQFSIN